MATTLGALLDDLTDSAGRIARTPVNQADAATALGHIGRALSHLREDGVSFEAGRRRERDIGGLATACVELAKHAPVEDGPLARLAAAAADSLAVLHGISTVSSRWAVAAAMTDAVTPLIGVVEPTSGRAVQLAEQVNRWSLRVQHGAALDPPAAGDAALLDRPLAGVEASSGRNPADLVPDAVAVILGATSGSAPPPTVAEVLMYSLAAETVTSVAQQLPVTSPPAGHLASLAWRTVREVLHPFDDGSRRRHPHAPPAVAAAVRLNGALTSAPAQELLGSSSVRGVVAAAVQHMPTLAENLLYRTVRSWSDGGGLVAFARDLPPREERLAPYLRGYRPGGLVRANAADLQPVVGALHNARLLSLAVAVSIDEAHPPGFPRRAHAANQELLRQPEAAGALEVATRDAARQMLLGRARQHGPSRPR